MYIHTVLFFSWTPTFLIQKLRIRASPKRRRFWATALLGSRVYLSTFPNGLPWAFVFPLREMGDELAPAVCHASLCSPANCCQIFCVFERHFSRIEQVQESRLRDSAKCVWRFFEVYGIARASWWRRRRPMQTSFWTWRRRRWRLAWWRPSAQFRVQCDL